ncbi:MAG: hypothetical protein ABIE22_05220 [archaeon]
MTIGKKTFLIFLTLVLVSSLVLGADYHGNLGVDVGDGSIVIGPPGNGECIEDWSCSYWSSCVNSSEAFVCVDCNTCGTYDLIPETCGDKRACGSSGSDGGTTYLSGGGGGGSSSSSNKKCVELWQCGAWTECVNGKQTRECSDSNNCGTVALRPGESRDCEGGIVNDEGGNLVGPSETEVNGGILGAVTGLGGRIAQSKVALSLMFIIILLVLAVVLVLLRRYVE